MIVLDGLFNVNRNGVKHEDGDAEGGHRDLPWTLRAHVPILIPFQIDESQEEAVTSVKDRENRFSSLR